MLLAIASLAMWTAFQLIAEKIIEQWGRRIAEIQVHYDSGRLLQPLEREIALARQMAESKIIKRWIVDPEVPGLKAQAMEEMESYRRNFLDQSYFLALLDSGDYYHNNRRNEFAGRQWRYRLDPKNPADAWFYRLVEENRPFHLNVNPDETLGVTKLWIDVLIRDGSRILGIVGTGLELQNFLDDIVDIKQPGITTLFLDYHGAIQLYKDQHFIEFASFIKPEGQKNTIAVLLDKPADYLRLQATMEQLAKEPVNDGVVKTDFITVDGKRHLLGIAYLPSIGWYEVTLMDLDQLLPLSQFLPIAVLFLVILVTSLLVFFVCLNHLLLSPLNSLEQAMVRARDGDLKPSLPPRGYGEIRRLIGHFLAMAESISEHTRELEAKIRERTEDLDRLARIDALTGLLNRRGMTEALHKVGARARRDRSRFGIIWIDLDHFKQINDSHGHAAGDRVLIATAQLLQDSIRTYDHVSRWGGDEFLALLTPCDFKTLQQIGERIRAGIDSGTKKIGPHVTVSIGFCLAATDHEIEVALKLADEALYRAKASGRNRICGAGESAA